MHICWTFTLNHSWFYKFCGGCMCTHYFLPSLATLWVRGGWMLPGIGHTSTAHGTKRKWQVLGWRPKTWPEEHSLVLLTGRPVCPVCWWLGVWCAASCWSKSSLPMPKFWPGPNIQTHTVLALVRSYYSQQHLKCPFPGTPTAMRVVLAERKDGPPRRERT